jgi:hypothetical protein
MFQIQVTGLEPINHTLRRIARAVEGILIVLQAGVDEPTKAAIDAAIADLKTSSDDLAASVAGASDPKP